MTDCILKKMKYFKLKNRLLQPETDITSTLYSTKEMISMIREALRLGSRGVCAGISERG